MKIIKFKEIEDDLKRSLEKSIKSTGILPDEKGFSLLEGFMNQPFQAELSGSFIIGGPSIPLVAIIGNTTGRVYFFAIKVLLPELFK